MTTTNDVAMTPLKEGSATILLPTAKQDVFYNRVQVVNRDLSIAAITVFNDMRREELDLKAASKPAATEETRTPAVLPPLKILEALSATGLRSIRYLNEIPAVESIIVNDLDRAAVKTIERNIEYNVSLVAESEREAERARFAALKPSCADANVVMGMHQKRSAQFDVIDLDPYGSANIFIEAALRAVKDGGLLCITCTDLAVLAGSRPIACYAKYASMPHRGRHCHEMALRIVLAFVNQCAARYGLYIEPLLSTHIDFYVRLFVRVRSSALKAGDSVLNVSNVFQCCSCSEFVLVPLAKLVARNGKEGKLTQGTVPTSLDKCSTCDSAMKMAGPWWNGPLHSTPFVERILTVVADQSRPIPFAAAPRITALLSGVKDELDVPLFMCLADMCHTLHCEMPKIAVVRSAIINAGYKVSASHTLASALKTTAPTSVLWDILRCWIKIHPVKVNENQPSFKILATEPNLIADFTIVKSQRRPTIKVPKFLPNPESNWGPMSRATGGQQVKRAADSAPIETNSDKKVKIVTSPTEATPASADNADNNMAIDEETTNAITI